MTLADTDSGRPARRPETDTQLSGTAAGTDTVSGHFLVEGMHCGGCVNKIERALMREAGVIEARANLTNRRLTLRWDPAASDSKHLTEVVERLGFKMVSFDPERLLGGDQAAERELLRAMAVAGFAAANVMLLSVSVWAGHAEDMGPATRGLMHWLSALIALPAIVYAGIPFFRSAWSALRSRTMNMDVPISLAITLAAGMSLYETAQDGAHAYFDSAVTLLFFLLVGRYLDRRARGRARSAVANLIGLGARSVTILAADGSSRVVPPDAVTAKMTVIVAPGERVPVDGKVILGASDLDVSLITGESAPEPVAPGGAVYAGTVNLTGALRVSARAVGEGTLLAEIARLMEAAESRKGRYVVLADRIVRFYAPAVHLAAALTIFGWLLFSDIAWQTALTYGVAVLIVTCPCALALAVPVVQVVANGCLMRRGVLLKSGPALERLADVDTFVFDKTGTLTLGRPELVVDGGWSREDLRDAAAMAAASRHPLACALAASISGVRPWRDVSEEPGAGLRRATDSGEFRLGHREWCSGPDDVSVEGPELWFRRPGREPVRFVFRDRLRADAREVIEYLKGLGREVVLLSGDRPQTVSAVAAALGIEDWRAQQTPADKVLYIETLNGAGRTVCMVGDGLNDAPALAAAAVSISPSSAADINRNKADIVFQGQFLSGVTAALETARGAGRLVRQNFAMAFAYNLLTVPLAMGGFVTPLIAAIAMSTSSIAVVLNALRLGWRR